MINERRKIPRYLCSDKFSDSCLYVGTDKFSLVSINYNRRGIGLFSHQHISGLNEQDTCFISFQLETEEETIIIDKIVCTIINIYETEVGHQFGIKFNTEKDPIGARYKRLEAIELALETQNNQEDRYGLLGD